MRKLGMYACITGLILTLSLFCSITLSHAVTTSGSLIVDEIWSGTINLTGDVTVPQVVTLTIEAGTEVVFPPEADDTAGGSDSLLTELIINGSLVAEGTEGSPIFFTSGAFSDAKGDWGGIRINSRESLTLRCCTVEYAILGVECRASGFNANVTIEESIIRETSGDGIAIYSEAGVVRTVSLTGNEVYANDGIGIRVYATGSNTVFTNTVTGNSVYDNGSYGIYFDTRSSAKTTSTVSGNEIYNNVTYGLYSYGYNSAQASADISGNTIHDSGIGIYILNSSSSSPFLSIADNTIYNSSEGIYCFTQNGGSSMSPLIEGNNIYNNTGNGIYVYGYRYQSFNNPTIRHNTVTNNSIDGIRVYRLGGTVLPVITLNEVTGNIGRGLSIQSSGSAAIVQNTVTGNGEEGVYINSVEVANVNFNNIAENSGAYEIYNDSVSAVDARYNWWGESPTAQMNVGDNPKNITKVYDIYDKRGRL